MAMATATGDTRRGVDGGRTLARFAALWGIAGAVGLGSLRASLNDPPAQRETVGNVAFAVAFLAPFAVAFAARWVERDRFRAAIWLGTGALGLLLSVTAFSGVSLLFLPSGVLLLVAARNAHAAGSAAETGERVWPAVPVAPWLVGVGVVAFVLLLAREDPRCAAQVRTADGSLVWEKRTAATVSDGAPRASSCVSDVTTDAEGAASLGVWAVGIGGIFGLSRLGRPPAATRLGVLPSARGV